MKAVQLVELGAPLELREVARPRPGADELLVKVAAAGICHSDAHYRAGTSGVGFLPLTLGHEIAGTVAEVGADVTGVKVGDRVALHYLFTCGRCEYCVRGLEQFCPAGKMVGKHAHGGYAEYVVAPARNAIPVPEGVGLETAAIMMCSSATAFHALRKARMAAGERVAVFGAGGLGLSAVQLARACGAAEVYAVDVSPEKLGAASSYGAKPVSPAEGAPETQLRDFTEGQGVDVALEFAGLPLTQRQAVASLAAQGRAALVGISGAPFAVESYATIINREAEIIGVSDHLHGELTTLMMFAHRGLLELEGIIADRVPLDAEEINSRLDALAEFRGETRSVILPGR
jgi:propanol-preferring alcohol dehydrogenase